MKGRTLTEVFLYLDSIFVDRDCLAWDKSALVVGLLEGHKLKGVLGRNYKLQTTWVERPRLVNSRGNHVANVICSRVRRDDYTTPWLTY